jgi:hypothetical protein
MILIINLYNNQNRIHDTNKKHVNYHRFEIENGDVKDTEKLDSVYSSIISIGTYHY